MATYAMIGKYSQKAMEGISAERTGQAVALMAKHGGKLEAGYAMLGRDDLLLIADFPDTASAVQASVALTKSMGIAFDTSPAVSVAEFDKLVCHFNDFLTVFLGKGLGDSAGQTKNRMCSFSTNDFLNQLCICSVD